MGRSKYGAWRVELLTMAVLAVSVVLVRPNLVRQMLPEPASRFLAYYDAARWTSVKDNFWERITYSIILSTSETKTAQKEARR